MPDPQTPLTLDQPQTHVYEPPHAIETEVDGYIDGDWFTKPGRRATEHPWVWATVNKQHRMFDISAIKTAGMDAGEALKVAGFLVDAVRWATGEIDRLNNESAARVAEQTAADNLAARTRMVVQGAPDVTDSPARQEDAHEQDACGV
jgi:hypothetical protein